MGWGKEPTPIAALDWLIANLPPLLACEPAAVRPEATLAELGADSADIVDITAAIEDRLFTVLPEGSVTGDTTITALAALIDGPKS